MGTLGCVGAKVPIERMIAILTEQREPKLDDCLQVVEPGAPHRELVFHYMPPPNRS